MGTQDGVWCQCDFSEPLYAWPRIRPCQLQGARSGLQFYCQKLEQMLSVKNFEFGQNFGEHHVVATPLFDRIRAVEWPKLANLSEWGSLFLDWNDVYVWA